MGPSKHAQRSHHIRIVPSVPRPKNNPKLTKAHSIRSMENKFSPRLAAFVAEKDAGGQTPGGVCDLCWRYKGFTQI